MVKSSQAGSGERPHCVLTPATAAPPVPYQAEKRAEALKRGKEDFYTTDAKFDERFKLAYGLNEAKVRRCRQGQDRLSSCCR